ncbi:membrane protein [Actinorhabdospora filicis]|uniref:Membrane protein n=2 Tax=Actinorhabdospora filicis TaxID=1785913 RepID=A0A9W6W988_9ACTN|nr:DUF4307 domain-containing protein [Actinorhabdospora filicis]GLZ76430.1 membrane protein [Actinorhabdospora filicis]
MSETRTTPVRFPRGRYGRRREGRRGMSRPLVVIAAVVAVLGGLAISVKLYQQYGDTDYAGQIISYETHDASVDITFSVTKPDGESALCQVRARSRDGAEVGRAEVSVPSDGETVTMTYTLSTSGDRPVTGEVQRCYPAKR